MAIKIILKKTRPQESEELPSLLFLALVVESFLLFEIRTIRRFIATELESIDSPIVLCEPCPTTTGLERESNP